MHNLAAEGVIATDCDSCVKRHAVAECDGCGMRICERCVAEACAFYGDHDIEPEENPS